MSVSSLTLLVWILFLLRASKHHVSFVVVTAYISAINLILLWNAVL
jgi:hypothetical protein